MIEIAGLPPVNERILRFEPLPLGLPDQSMRESRIRRARLLVESKRDADLAAVRRHLLIELPRFFGAELARAVSGPLAALGGMSGLSSNGR